MVASWVSSKRSAYVLYEGVQEDGQTCLMSKESHKRKKLKYVGNDGEGQVWLMT